MRLNIAVALVLVLVPGASAGPVYCRDDCPTVTATCPAEVPEGGPLTFTVSVTDGDEDVTPTYSWTVSAGTISSGQGTSTIEVDLTGVAAGETVTATVDVGGYSAECSTWTSCTSTLTTKP